MRFLVSSSPSPAPAAPPLAAVTAATASWRPPSTLPILPVGRRREHHQHCLLQLRRRPGETTTLRRRGLALAVVRALQQPNHFAKETKLIWRRQLQISICTFEGYLYQEAIEMSGEVCSSAEKAVSMASQVEDSARLTTTMLVPAPEGMMIISTETVHQTLGAYVDVFVQTAEDSYHRRVTVETVASFLDALRGLVSIAHILLDAALETLSRTHPRESVAEYAYNYDVKSMRREFDWMMEHLEDTIRKATAYDEKCKLALPTILEGVKATKYLLGLMAVRRQRALGKAKKVVP